MSQISQIDNRRAEHGIAQAALCEAAKVHPTTYCALKNKRRGGNARTLERLTKALDALVNGAVRQAHDEGDAR